MKTIAEIIASSKNKPKVKDFIEDVLELRKENVSYKDILVYLEDREVIVKEKSLIAMVYQAKKKLSHKINIESSVGNINSMKGEMKVVDTKAKEVIVDTTKK